MDEQLIGHITHYFDHLNVAVVKLTDGDLKVGDQIHITGHADFQQTVESMQVDHQPVEAAAKDSEVAIKLAQAAKSHDKIYKLSV